MTDAKNAAVERVAAELDRLHNAARGCEFDLAPKDGPIAQLVLFMHKHGDIIIAALRAPSDQAQPAASEAMREALELLHICADVIGRPVDGVHILDDDDLVEGKTVVSGHFLKRLDAALASQAQPSDEVGKREAGE